MPSSHLFFRTSPLLIAFVLGCHTNTDIALPKSGEQLAGNPDVLMVTRQDGSSVKVYVPVIARDSLIGWLTQPTANEVPTSRVAIPDVRSISTGKPAKSTAANLLGATGMLAIAGLVFIGAALAAWSLDSP